MLTPFIDNILHFNFSSFSKAKEVPVNKYSEDFQNGLFQRQTAICIPRNSAGWKHGGAFNKPLHWQLLDTFYIIVTVVMLKLIITAYITGYFL